MWIAKLNTLWYVGFQPLFFLSYYLLEFDELIFFFSGDIQQSVEGEIQGQSFDLPGYQFGFVVGGRIVRWTRYESGV